MSGFSYPEWIGEIYPEGTKRKDMLATYATIFPAVEINMSFRRNPLPKTIDTWRDAVADGFTLRDEGEPAHHALEAPRRRDRRRR